MTFGIVNVSAIALDAQLQRLSTSSLLSMLIYVFAFVSVAAFAAIWWLQRVCAPATYLFYLCRQLKPLLEALAAAGIACSALQIVILWSNDYTSSAAALGSIEGRLRAYRMLERTFSLNEWQSIAVYAVLIILALYALLASGLAARRGAISALRRWSKTRTLAAWLAGIMLFGSLLPGGVVQERAMELEAHASRIEQAYVPVVTSAVDRLDLYLTTVLLNTLDSDEQWRSLRELSRRLSSDVNQLQRAYPDLYTAANEPGRFPAAPLIALPRRADPLHNAAAGASIDVRLERFAALFAGADTEDISQLELARAQSIAQAIRTTRGGWSEENAALLAQDLAAEDVIARSEAEHDVAWRLARRVGVAMYEQAEPQVRGVASNPDWTALPWRFIKLFLDDVVDDEARDRLAGSAQRELAHWLARQGDWSSVASDYSQRVAEELREKAAVNRDARRRDAQAAVDAAAAEYAVARAQLAEDMHRFAADAFARRWAALEQIWTSGAARLPPGPRDSAVRVLGRARRTLEVQRDPWQRVALLAKIEAPWRIANASLANESQSALFQTMAAAIIVAESSTLRSRQFADENRDAILQAMGVAIREQFSAAVGRIPKPSEGYKLDAFLRQMFTDVPALTAAALQHLSRDVAGAPANVRSVSSTNECIIEGMLTTSLVRGEVVASRATQTVAIPCW